MRLVKGILVRIVFLAERFEMNRGLDTQLSFDIFFEECRYGVALLEAFCAVHLDVEGELLVVHVVVEVEMVDLQLVMARLGGNLPDLLNQLGRRILAEELVYRLADNLIRGVEKYGCHDETEGGVNPPHLACEGDSHEESEGL